MTNETEIAQVGPIQLPIEVDRERVQWFELRLFHSEDSNYLCLEKNVKDVDGEAAPLVRIESACTFAHLFASQKCDCEWQLREAKRLIGSEDRGLIIYAYDQHGRGVGLWNHVRVYMTEAQGFSTAAAHKKLGLEVDARQYDEIVRILRFYGFDRIRLLTNNPRRIHFLEANGIEVERIPLEAPVNEFNEKELVEKKAVLGHELSILTIEEWEGKLRRMRQSSEDQPALLVRALTDVVGKAHSQSGNSDSIRSVLAEAGAKAKGSTLIACTILSDGSVIRALVDAGVQRVVAQKFSKDAYRALKAEGLTLIPSNDANAQGSDSLRDSEHDGRVKSSEGLL